MEPESVNVAQGIRNPADSLSPDSKVHKPWSPESTAYNPEDKIVLDYLTWGDVCFPVIEKYSCHNDRIYSKKRRVNIFFCGGFSLRSYFVMFLSF